MKAILVIDMPNELDVNDLLIDYCVHTKGEYKQIRKGGNYSLKPMPDIKTEEAIKLANMINPKATFQEFADGWNACIEEIKKNESNISY